MSRRTQNTHPGTLARAGRRQVPDRAAAAGRPSVSCVFLSKSVLKLLFAASSFVTLPSCPPLHTISIFILALTNPPRICNSTEAKIEKWQFIICRPILPQSTVPQSDGKSSACMQSCWSEPTALAWREHGECMASAWRV